MNKKLENDELGRPSAAEARKGAKLPIVVLLDNVRSMSNVGSIFRTCDAFGVSELLLAGITPKPPHREIQKTALGATESVPWRSVQDIKSELNRLRERDYLICAIEQAEKSIHPENIQYNEYAGVCLILGNEVTGVDQEIVNVSDVVAEIPQMGAKHSINVTVAAGVVIWEAYKALRSH